MRGWQMVLFKASARVESDLQHAGQAQQHNMPFHITAACHSCPPAFKLTSVHRLLSALCTCSLLYGEQARFFEDEIKPHLKHKRKGTVGMASAGENLNASQFYITAGDNVDSLDGKHTIFGQVSVSLGYWGLPAFRAFAVPLL